MLGTTVDTRESGHFSFEPLVSGSHFAGVLASVLGGIWKNYIFMYIPRPPSHRTRQVCPQLRAERGPTTCLAMKVVRTTGSGSVSDSPK